MSTRAVPLQGGLPQPQRPTLRILKREPVPISLTALRVGFWAIGLLLASAQAWVSRYQLSADSICYLDMSDALQPGSSWQRLINGVWSPLYPFILGVFRRAFHISPNNENAAAHFLNIGFFVFAFLCFEFLLRGVLRTPADDGSSLEVGGQPIIPMPKWAVLIVAYSLFLWASIGDISLTRLRPDMLMSAFVYLAVAVLLRMRHTPARWSSYLALGTVLGVGFLAKAPMLPIGILLLMMTLFAVEDWRPALKMAATALALLLLIGSLYFVPLSLQRGYFTMGQSGQYNYVVHVNAARPAWYLQSPGGARGSFLRPPARIFSNPAAYAFSIPAHVTHPLRFDPSYWLAGVRPHFAFRQQLHALKTNLYFIKLRLLELRVIAGAVFVLAFLCSGWKQIVKAAKVAWPVWIIGLAGCAMYSVVNVEPRYVAAFLALFWLGLFFGFPLPRETGRRIALLIALATTLMFLYPTARRSYAERVLYPHANADAQAAQALASVGIRPGDSIARISPLVSDFGMERILRVTVAAEVDYAYATQFWTSSLATQRDLLGAFAARGVRAVIATSPKLSAENESEWTRLGSTQYWVWLPNRH